PPIAIGVAERHRNVSNDSDAGLIRAIPDPLYHRSIFLERLILISAQKGLRNGTRIAECAHRSGRERTLRPFFINNNPDDLHSVQGPELREHLFAIRHLWHNFRRDEAHGVDMTKARIDQPAKIFYLPRCRDLLLEPLPRIARTLDYFNCVHHGKLLTE